MLDNKILRNIQDVTDELYPALAMLKQYRHKEDVPFGFLMCVTLRAKIYKNIQRLIKMYKNQEPHADLLNRVLNQLKLHRFQIKKLSQTNPGTNYQSVNRYCIGLASLLHVAFTQCQKMPH